MPLLGREMLEQLQRLPIKLCETCGRPIRPNYCRECDEFFTSGHMSPTMCPDSVHDDHRTY